MTITSAGLLDEFVKRYPDAEGALAAWLHAARTANWRNLQEVRQSFRSADGVKVDSGRIVTVFNIRGNHYRLLTAISYRAGVLTILDCLTHAEYDKEKWKTTL